MPTDLQWWQLLAANAALKSHENHLLQTLQELQRSHSDLQRAQLQLVQAEKLESVGRLAAGVAHEVKNPLAVLALGLEYMRRHLARDAAEMRSVLDEMDAAVDRTLQIVHGLVDFAAPTVVRRRQVQLDDVVDRALDSLHREFAARGIDVQRRRAARLSLVWLDPEKMQQAFTSLCRNAVEAMGDSGTLRVETSVEATGIEAALGSRVVVRVADTGPGIPADHLTRIFDPFFTTKPGGRGTGLGLTMLKRIVDMHGGSVEVRNVVRAGAEFAVALPIAGAASEGPVIAISP